MKRLQKNFSRDLQNTLSLLGQSDLGSPIISYQKFTHHNNSAKKSPIQIISTSQAQNSSKPKQKPKTKMKAKQNSPKLSSKRKVPVKKHQKNSSDQISINSILENPISSSDPYIKKMFTLFNLDRAYRQKKIEKIFYFWYKKLTRKLLKIRLDSQKSQSMIQSSSIIHISTPTTDQLTQTELLSDSDSDILNFSNEEAQDYPNIVNELSDTQLIHNVITGSSIFNNNSDDDDEGTFLEQNKNKQNNNKEQEQNLLEDSFISWKSEKISNDIVNQTCDLASTIIKKSVPYEDSHFQNENIDYCIDPSLSNEINDIQSRFSKFYDDEHDSTDNYLDSSENNDYSLEGEFNSVKRFNEDLISAKNQYMQANLFSQNEDDLINDKLQPKTSIFKSSMDIEPQLSRKERNRPPPVDIEAKSIPTPKILEVKAPETKDRARPESELKKYLRNIITEEFFESVRYAQIRNDISLPLFVIPPNIQKPWQFTNEYCELIIDVVNEFAHNTDLNNYTTEEFLDYLSNFFEKSHNQRNKTIFSELDSLYQKKFNDFLLTYSIDVADSLLQYQLDSILGI